MPAFSTAQTSHAPETSAQTKLNDDLSRTEQRLADLIKAAAAQDLLDVNTDIDFKNDDPNHSSGSKNPQEIAAFGPSENTRPNTQYICADTDMLEFTPETFVDGYDDILILKSAMITGPDQIDQQKAHTLTMAYLGLGFADEAINIAAYLQPETSRIIKAAARVITDQHPASLPRSPQKYFKFRSNQCSDQTKDHFRVWTLLAQQNYQSPTETDLAQTDKLPPRLRKIFLRKLGIKTVQNGDLKSANIIRERLHSNSDKLSQISTGSEYDIQSSPVQVNDEMRFFEALLSALDQNVDTRRSGLKALKSIAQHDGMYQAQSLQALADIEMQDMSGDKKTRDITLYPGYILDLNSAAQTFSDQPQGQNVQAQKINYLAKKRLYAPAIAIVRQFFAPDDISYQNSASLIGNYVLSDLEGADNNIQLSALDLLLSDAQFFEHLDGIQALNNAAVGACVNLELYSLVANIMPKAHWHTLDESILQKLILQNLTTGTNTQIPQHIAQAPAFKTASIRRAFKNHKPMDALAIKKSLPVTTDATDTTRLAHQVFTRAAWDNGYWSLAKKGQTELELLTPDAQKSRPDLQLATTLSSLSPSLISSRRPQNLQDMQALQSHLISDLKIFKTYMSKGNTPIDDIKSGAPRG